MKTKFNLKFWLLLFFALNLSLTSFGANVCEKIYPKLGQANFTGPIKLKAGDTIWGYFTCQGCEVTYSSKPNYENRQVCPGCGNPHNTSDKYTEPAMLRVQEGNNSVLYLINPNELVQAGKETALAKSGASWSCPFCQSANFQTVHTCEGCGAVVENADKVFAATDATASPNNLNVDSNLYTISTSKNQSTISLNKTEAATANKGWQAFLGTKVAPVIGITALGLFIYGNQTFTLPGEVTALTASSVQIHVQDGKNDKIIELNPAKVKTGDKWRIGQKVKIYFKNFGGAKGVERQDGSAYPVLLEKDNG